MYLALWIINAFLALAFLATGGLKLLRSRPQLVAIGMHWTEDYTLARIKWIGVAEVVGAAGLILPLATGIALILAPLAASALTLLMIGAVVTHARRKEGFAPSLILGVLSLVSAVLGFVLVA